MAPDAGVPLPPRTAESQTVKLTMQISTPKPCGLISLNRGKYVFIGE